MPEGFSEVSAIQESRIFNIRQKQKQPNRQLFFMNRKFLLI